MCRRFRAAPALCPFGVGGLTRPLAVSCANTYNVLHPERKPPRGQDRYRGGFRALAGGIPLKAIPVGFTRILIWYYQISVG